MRVVLDGSRVSHHMAAAGVDQTTFAATAGVASATLARAMRGEAITGPSARKICFALERAEVVPSIEAYLPAPALIAAEQTSQ